MYKLVGMKYSVCFGLILLLVVLGGEIEAQEVINAYARVTDVSGTTLTISDADVTNDDFAVGEQLIIMQMQDDVIGGNTGNNPSFGDISTIASAGLYEKATIASVDMGTNEIVLTSTLSNTYNTGANSLVQVISFPSFENFSTTDDLTALEWNGIIGGVFAIKVTGTFTLNHNINLDGAGFRGGDLNPSNESNGNCEASVYRTNDGQYGRKGEGVYLNSNTAYEGARAKMANGGGGGNKHNSGGGGGGNFTAGGAGGPGYNESDNAAGCYDDPAGDAGTGAGGYGGVDLSDYVTASRIFMGGGGGGGQQDNSAGGDSEEGGDGGGIIMIQANTVSVPCGSGVSITANGEGFPYPSVDAGWEGAPGAGAGGTLLFQVNTWALSCSLVTEAKGGEGQSSTYTLPHGGGGGGGKGVSIFSGSVPASNFSSDNSQGAGGINGTEPASGSAEQGNDTPENPAYQGGASNGVIESEEGPLPVVLRSWEGTYENGYNLLKWVTVSEIENDYFTIEKLKNETVWMRIATVSGNGTTNQPNEYLYRDLSRGEETAYYRLSQTDFDGTTERFDVITVLPNVEVGNVLVYPNPNSGLFTVQLPLDGNFVNFEVLDIMGKTIEVVYRRVGDKVEFDMGQQAKGTYLLKLSTETVVQIQRVQLR
ncbi:hypothetical protein BGP76_13845 [Reichenbachiella sp. MSK19-1]|nr:hypothetical protein BGP76_13845 [Reichenbachiella sp. MSK19-1]